MKDQPFSKRYGYSSQPKEVTIWEDAPVRLRYWIWKTTEKWEWKAAKLYKLLCDVVGEPPNYDAGWTKISAEKLMYSCPWFRVYEIIEAIAETLGEQTAAEFARTLNEFLAEEGIGWQLVDGKVIRRGSEAFEETVGTAIQVLEENEQPTAASHLRFAIAALSIKPKPNTSGAVSQATSAVECVLGEITSTAMTLGKYLDKNPQLFHPSFKKGLDGIYGYATDEGARHGKEGTEPKPEDAEFVVAVCAATCTLLTRKHAGGNQ